MDVHQRFMATAGLARPSMFLRLILALVAEGDATVA
jgi:hypothetical protein